MAETKRQAKRDAARQVEPVFGLDQVADAILALKTRDEVRRFLRDLCTLTELEALAHRWQIAQLLDQGRLSYVEIAERFGWTYTKVNRALTEGRRRFLRVYAAIESPRGELGCFVLADGSAKPARVHMRDPSFVNLQALRHMAEGGLIADLIAGVAMLDPILGGIDR